MDQKIAASTADKNLQAQGLKPPRRRNYITRMLDVMWSYFRKNPRERYAAVATLFTLVAIWFVLRSNIDLTWKTVLLIAITIASIPMFSYLVTQQLQSVKQAFGISSEWTTRIGLALIGLLATTAAMLGHEFAVGSVLVGTGLPIADFPQPVYLLTVIYASMLAVLIGSSVLIIPSYASLWVLRNRLNGWILSLGCVCVAVYLSAVAAVAFTKLLPPKSEMLNEVITGTSFVENDGACTNLVNDLEISPLDHEHVIAFYKGKFRLASCNLPVLPPEVFQKRS